MAPRNEPTPQTRSMPANAGLTLIELLVVITILGFLSTIATVKVIEFLDKGKVAKAQADITSFKTALKMYRVDNHRYPTASEGLEALMDGSDDMPDGYLEEFNPDDPWENPYEYSIDGNKYLIISWGRDGQEGGEGFDRDIRSDDTGSDKN